MKNHYTIQCYLVWLLGLLLVSSTTVQAQLSPNTVKYRVTYDVTTQLYTAWVVPDYATPNSNGYNLGINELVSTAQFTLKVPTGFVIQTITDASGSQTWDKTPTKLGPGLSLTATNGSVFTQNYSPAVLDPAYAYYVIGKSPSESNLGPFSVGTPVALFTFKGNGCFGPIQPIPPGDPFIQAALDTYSFNVPNSFYSSSGQPQSGNQDPLEQFINISGAPASCFQPPITTPDIANTSVDKSVTGNVLTNDSDPQGGVLVATLLGQPGSGTVVLSPTGSYTYTPPTGFTGVVSFCYSASNTAGLSSTACVTINVSPDPSPTANDRPIANNDATQTTAGVSVTINVAANDTDPDPASTLNGQLSNPTLVAQPSSGTVTVVNGQFVYTPPATFTGVVTFPYQICDKATPALCATAVVTVNVQPTPPVGTTLAPVAVDDALLTQKDTPKTGTVAANDSDPQGLPLTYTTGQPANGTVLMSPTGSYTYTPPTGFVGPTSFTYVVCNTAGKCAVATVSVTVQPGCLLPALTFLDINAFSPLACGGSDGYILLTSLPLSTGITVNYQKNGLSQTYTGSSDANGTLTIPNLGPGTYGLFTFQTPSCVSDVYTGTAVVGAGAPPAPITAINLSKINPTACASATGSILISGLTASTSYTISYSKNGGSPQTLVATTNASGQINLSSLAAGTYGGFTYQLSAGCPSTPSSATLVLTDPAAPTLAQSQLSGTNPTACGTATGTLLLSGLLPSTSYTINYTKNGGAAQTVVQTSNGSGQITITGLGQGSYQLSGLGASNCMAALTLPAIVLTDPAGPVLTQNQVLGTNPTGCNTNTGSLILSGLTASVSYSVTYAKNGGATQTVVLGSSGGGVIIIPNLGMGNYSITNLGTSNCTSIVSLTATLSDPASPVLTAASLVPTNPATCGSATGSFSVTGLAANATYTLSYQKDGGAVQTATLISNASGVISLTGLSTGSYANFILTNSLGCSSAPLVGPFSLSNPSLPTPTAITLTGVNAGCAGIDGKLLLTGLTAGQTFIFHYQFGSVAKALSAVVNVSGVLSVTGLLPGTYSNFFITQGVCKSGTYPGPITINAICQPPVATPDIANTNVGKPVTGNVLTNDSDPQGGQLTASLINQPISGTVTFNPDGTYTYTPPTNFTGVANFCYVATNTSGLSSTACVTINVNPDPSPTTNNRPIANNDATQTTMGTSVTINVVANDTNPDAGPPNSATTLNGQLSNPTLVAQPSSGTVTVVNGQFVYTPPATFTGVVTFPYQVCDKATPALCATAVVTVNIQPTPPVGTTLAPVAVDDALLTQKDTPKTGTVAGNDSDPQGLPLTYTTGQPASGTVLMSPTGSYTYTPPTGFVGPTSFTYSVCNTAGKCAVATVSVDVQKPTNQPPVVIGEPLVTRVNKPATVCLPIVDGDLTDTHSVTICGQPGSGTLAASVNNVTHVVCLTYTPTSTFSGATTACITVCDAAGSCTTTIVPITVLPTSQTLALPQPPVVVVDPVVTTKDIPVTVCMAIVDPNLTDTHSVSVCNSPAKGTATASLNNLTHEVCVIYTPSSGSVGPDAICLTVCDQGGLCTTVTVPVTVVDPTPPGSTPKPPVVTPTPIVTTVGQPVVVCTGIADNVGDTHTATICGQPASGTAQVGIDNVTHALCVTYTPGSSPVSTTVCVQVCDQGGLCTTVILPITILPTYNEPIMVLKLKVMLQGALIGGTGGLMRDDLRSKGFLPAREPYTAIGGARFTHVNGGGGETMPASVTALNVGTGDAVVDWVFVELRSPANMSAVVATRSAMVQRDGDVVLASDGVSPLSFSGLSGTSFYVSVKHRNHLGAMTATAIPLSLTGTVVDFTSISNSQLWNTTIGAFDYEGWEQTTVSGKQALWAGDANHNGKVKYQGGSNDLITIFSEVIAAQGVTTNPLYNYDNALGYYFGDVNMDGKVKYQGSSTDTSLIFTNVITNYSTLNSGQLYNFDFMLEQIP